MSNLKVGFIGSQDPLTLNQEDVKILILSLFNGLGLVGDDLETAATIAVKSHFEKSAQMAFENIPSYAEEKVRRRDCNQKWDSLTHYDTYWKPWAERGLLYLYQLRKYDQGLVDSIEGVCRRNGQDPSDHLPPTKSVRVTEDAKIMSQLSLQNGIRAVNTVKVRKTRNKKTQTSESSLDP